MPNQDEQESTGFWNCGTMFLLSAAVGGVVTFSLIRLLIFLF